MQKGESDSPEGLLYLIPQNLLFLLAHDFQFSKINYGVSWHGFLQVYSVWGSFLFMSCRFTSFDKFGKFVATIFSNIFSGSHSLLSPGTQILTLLLLSTSPWFTFVFSSIFCYSDWIDSIDLSLHSWILSCYLHLLLSLVSFVFFTSTIALCFFFTFSISLWRFSNSFICFQRLPNCLLKPTSPASHCLVQTPYCGMEVESQCNAGLF